MEESKQREKNKLLVRKYFLMAPLWHLPMFADDGVDNDRAVIG